jgi:hypothetical protein
MKKIALSLLMALSSFGFSQGFLPWTSDDTTIFKILQNGTAEYEQPSGGFRKTITSQELFIPTDSVQMISFMVTGFTNGGFNSCNIKPQMTIKLLNQNGGFISNIDTFELGNQNVMFNTPMTTSGFYRISITIYTSGCNNNSTPTITLSNLTVPLILLPNRISKITSRVNPNSVELSWKVFGSEGVDGVQIFKLSGEDWMRIGDFESGANDSYSFRDETPGLTSETYRVILVDSEGGLLGESLATVLTGRDLAATQISVWPNPIENSSTLNFSDFASGAISDLSGRRVLEFTNTRLIDVSGLTPGVYFATGRGSLDQPFKIKILK